MLLQSLRQRTDVLLGLALFCGVLALYVTTLAPGLAFGDPAEYTFVPHIWGVIHPPGYAFQTVLGGLWQRLIPIGTIAYRANLLSAVAGATIAVLVYGAVQTLTPTDWQGGVASLPALFAGASAGVATDIWQHSLHANAHIVTALLATLDVFLLLRWWRERERKWLFAFCAIAGLSVTHHPLLIFSFPAYAAFIIATEPRILTSWRALLGMLGFGLLGLSVWLYFPIRASLPTPVPFGADNMNTLDGFLDLVMARGLRVNLFYFGLRDQPDRALVFWSLLRLQYSLPVIVLMVVGLAMLIWRWRRVGLLYSLFLVVNLTFILNTIQDVMAYLMVPFAALATLAGVGALAALRGAKLLRRGHLTTLALAILLAIPPVSRMAVLAPHISLRTWREADAWVEDVYTRFQGMGEGAILLTDWEHLTPLWYAEFVEEHPLQPDDVQLVYVATTSDQPWVDNVWEHLEDGPVYLSGYRREVVEEGFRLRPIGSWLYQVLPLPAVQEPENITRLDAQAGPVTVVGYALDDHIAAPGDVIPLTLYLRADEPLDDIIFPYIELGEMQFNYTTDSHWLSPWWQPSEIIGERYDLRLPQDITPGRYSLRLGIRNLSQGQEISFNGGEALLALGEVRVSGDASPVPGTLMANVAHRLGLVQVTAGACGQRREAVWQEPLIVEPGDEIRVVLTWEALGPPDNNWKVFVHLINPNTNQPIAQQDNPPLGGAFPTFLWFPKWVVGQVVMDPYRFSVPLDAQPGEYQLEIGVYGFTSLQRAPFFDPDGNLTGDRFILGAVQVVAASE